MGFHFVGAEGETGIPFQKVEDGGTRGGMLGQFFSLGETEQAELRTALVELWRSHNQATEPTRTIVDSEYLEVVGVRG